ncbi:AMP-binding protein [Streptomyces luteireticuli]|uniref:AMP-binding protein n=1 Tax=Streptomyces luteireticuli TaxID=173858 RepID=UPI0035578709
MSADDAIPGHPTPLQVFGAATVPEALALAAAGPSGITVIDRELAEQNLPYAQLASSARRAAALLAAHGVGRGDRVALVSSTSPAMLVSLFGIWHAGAVPTILPPPHRIDELPETMRELDRRLDFVGARCVVVADALHRFVTRRLRDTGRPVLTCGELAAAQAPGTEKPAAGPDDLAHLQFTSGTTGPGRAVPLTHRQILTNAAASWDRLGARTGESVLVNWLPLYHDMGLVSFLGMVAGGGRAVLQPPEEFLRHPDSWVDALSVHRATHTVAPDFAYGLAARSMTERPRPLDLSALRMCGDGAEPIRLGNVEAFTTAGARYGLRPEALTPMYGLAEATLAVALPRFDEPLRCDRVSRTALTDAAVAEPVPADDPDARDLAVCGGPAPGVRIAIKDERGTDLGHRQVGEICVTGPSVMRGYWNDPEASEQALRDGWLHTGDLGYLTPEGLVVCGRLKDMIIVGGRNLYPEDYEQVAGEVEGAGRLCAAFSLPDPERMVLAAEIGRTGTPPIELARSIMTRTRERLGRAPDTVLVVPRHSLPRTSSGKPRRDHCRTGFLSGRLGELASVTRPGARAPRPRTGPAREDPSGRPGMAPTYAE